MTNAQGLPLQDPVVQGPKNEYGEPNQNAGKITTVWAESLVSMSTAISANPTSLAAVSLQTQGASISPTSFSTGAIIAGLYRISYYARVTRPATTSSSLTVTFGWTDGTVPCSVSDTAITGNATSTTGSMTKMLVSDAAAPITYSTTYASVGGTSMQYALYLLLERINS